MQANKPEQCDALLMKAMETGDVDAMVALYEPDAVFVVSPGRVVHGQPAIREVLTGMMAAKAKGEVEEVSVVMSADESIAVTRTRGTMTAPGPDGEPLTSPFHSVEVVRQQADGRWLFVIDDPGGQGAATR